MRLIQRHSPVTGELNAMYLDVTAEQLVAWRRGELVQVAMPQLTDDEREFLVSGCMPGEWEKLWRVEA